MGTCTLPAFCGGANTMHVIIQLWCYKSTKPPFLTKIMTWIGNYINVSLWNVIILLCPLYPTIFMSMQLFIHQILLESLIGVAMTMWWSSVLAICHWRWTKWRIEKKLYLFYYQIIKYVEIVIGDSRFPWLIPLARRSHCVLLVTLPFPPIDNSNEWQWRRQALSALTIEGDFVQPIYLRYFCFLFLQ